MLGARRVPALILTFLALIGTFGASDLDAWLYHRGGSEIGQTRPHYEPFGTTCGHADRCLLGITFPDSRVVSPRSTVGRLARVSRVPDLVPAPEKPRALVITSPQSRAPPLLPVPASVLICL